MLEFSGDFYDPRNTYWFFNEATPYSAMFYDADISNFGVIFTKAQRGSKWNEY